MSEVLKRLLKVLNIAINAQSHSVDAPYSQWFGGGDHLCPYGRKLIGSLVPVHSRSVRSSTYAFLDSKEKVQRKVTKEMWALWRCKVHIIISLFSSSVPFLSKSSQWSLTPPARISQWFSCCKSGTSSSQFVCFISKKKNVLGKWEGIFR